MSIVERALQKAQQAKGKPQDARSEPARPASSTPPAEHHVPTPPPAHVPPSTTALGRQADTDTLREDDLTSRDLKAIVQLDLARLREQGRLPPESMAMQTEDEIRRIKWPLLKAIYGGEGVDPVRNNVVLVTSALPGEGKTFTSLNLALSIVRDREMRVVLVDGDVARPGLTPALGLEGRAGLNDALEDLNRDVTSVTYQTDVEGLFFVPAGKWHQHSPEFFAGSRMPQLIEALSRRVGNGVIIVDSPPLLATNEAQVVTRLAGQVLLVVRAEETPQQAVLDAVALVDKSTPVRAVLNRVKPSVLSRYYGQYYYGQTYGYGYGHGRDSGHGKSSEGST